MMNGAPVASIVKPWAKAWRRWSMALERSPLYKVEVSVRKGLPPARFTPSTTARTICGATWVVLCFSPT